MAGPGGGVHFPSALINSSVLRDIRLLNILLIVHDTVLRHEAVSMLLFIHVPILSPLPFYTIPIFLF